MMRHKNCSTKWIACLLTAVMLIGGCGKDSGTTGSPSDSNESGNTETASPDDSGNSETNDSGESGSNGKLYSFPITAM